MVVSTPKGRIFTIRASDLYGARLKALAEFNFTEDRLALTQLGEALVAAYRDWLVTDYSPRYRLLTTDPQRHWLTQTVILVVIRHILEHKWTSALRQGHQTFADPWVASVVGHLALTHRLPGEMARLVHYVVREPEQQHALITQFVEDLYIRMSALPFVEPSPLPTLPAGVRLPLVSWFETLRATLGQPPLERSHNQ
jgi:hypothetical protein